MKRVLIFLLILICSCGTESDLKSDEPVTDGIYLTDLTGLVYDKWREPTSQSKSGNLQFNPPYGNPTSRELTLLYELPSKQEVDIWVLPARLPEENESNYMHEKGSDFISEGRIITLFQGEQEEGAHLLKWALYDGKIKVPQGFYRIYISSEGETLWHDTFVGEKGAPTYELIEYLNSLNE